MLNKIKTYYIITITFITAVLIFLLQRRGSTIRDLQREKLNQKMNDELKVIQEKVSKGEREYADALQKYRNLRDAYESMLRDGKE